MHANVCTHTLSKRTIMLHRPLFYAAKLFKQSFLYYNPPSDVISSAVNGLLKIATDESNMV